MATPRWLDETESRAWRGHLRMSWLLNAAIERDLLRQAGLSHADYYVLASLSEVEGGRLRMSELADGILWSKSRLSHQVARMEARDLVRREGCAGDARGTFCVLTPAGRRAIEEAAPDHVESVRRHLLDVLTPEQVEALAGITTTVVERLGGGAHPVASCPVDPPANRKSTRPAPA
jgi:DNA-binding MarR family transcriptional regulator